VKKSVLPIFLQIQRWSSFLQKKRAQIDQKTLPRSRIRHQTTKMKSLRIQPATMATLILDQHNNQPTIPHH
jgi:hypothetical protein